MLVQLWTVGFVLGPCFRCSNTVARVGNVAGQSKPQFSGIYRPEPSAPEAMCPWNVISHTPPRRRNEVDLHHLKIYRALKQSHRRHPYRTLLTFFAHSGLGSSLGPLCVSELKLISPPNLQKIGQFTFVLLLLLSSR